MIDLHIHTIHSDGDFTALEILKRAENEKLDIISITDHNQISAYDELAEIEDVHEYYKGKIIAGSELKCVYNHMPMEILAYGFELSKAKELDYIVTPEKLYNVQSNYLEYIKEKGSKIGLYFDNNLQINPQNIEYASSIFERELWKDERNVEILKRNGINMQQPFYREAQSNPNSIFYIDETKDYPNMQEVIDEIHSANGLAFLAHFYEYPINDYEKTIDEIVGKMNLDGIECCHSSFQKEQSEWIINFCKERKLYMSGGSDYHGKAKPKVQFGKAVDNKPIPNELVSDWIKNVKFIY